MPFSLSPILQTALAIDEHPLLIEPDVPVQNAIALMSQVRGNCSLTKIESTDDCNLLEARSSCGLVVAGQQLIGIFTQQDVVRLLAIGIPVKTLKVADVMTRSPRTIQPAQVKDVWTVLNRSHRIHPIPVVNEQGCPLGLLTPTSLRQAFQPIDLLRWRSVAEVMTASVIHALPTDSVLHLTKLMAIHRVSCVVIVEEIVEEQNAGAIAASKTGRQQPTGLTPVGIVTEEDIVQFQALELDAFNTQARVIMSAPLSYLKPEDSLWTADQYMQTHRELPLVVVGDRGELLGLVTQNHLLKALDSKQMFSLIDSLQDKISQLHPSQEEWFHPSAALRPPYREQIGQQPICTLALQPALLALEEFDSVLSGTTVALNRLQVFSDRTWKSDFFATGCTAVFGHTSAEFMADPSLWFSRIALEDQPLLASVFEDIFAERTATHEYRFRHPDGKWRWLLTQFSAKRDEAADCWRVNLVTMDISDRKQTETVFCQALEQEVLQLRSRFISMASHEFRTPLAIISSSSGILEAYGHRLDPEKKQQHLQRIQSTVAHMTQLLDDILTIHQADTEELKFRPEMTEIIPFCCHVIEELQAEFHQDSIVFSSHFSQSDDLPRQARGESRLETLERPIMVYLDRKLMRQVLVNLLSNAIKYSPQGGNISFNLIIRNDNVTFKIQDEGIGIPLDEQAQIFEAFYRAQNVGTIPGTGLGLAIAKKCVNLHGGSIFVNSQTSMGTLVIVTLPC